MSSGYELHQKLRTKTVRQVKKKAYDEAIATLYSGSLDLLAQKEQGSACDLAIYMIDVYGMKSQPCDSESRDRITDILEKCAADFWRKKVIDAAIKWSCKALDAPTTGDPLLRLFVAKLLTKEQQFHLAEPHFLAASIPTPNTYAVESAPKAFAAMMSEWLIQHSAEATKVQGETRDQNALERIEAGRFALRGTIPLLANRAVSQASSFLTTYIQTVTQRQNSLLLPVQPNPRPYVPSGAPASATSGGGAPSTNLQLYLTANPDLNFTQMATALVTEAQRIKASQQQQRTPEWLKSAWINLVRQYEREAPALQQEEGVRQSIPIISATYFDIQPPRAQSNMLSDMMASLFGGGGGAPGGSSAAQSASSSAQPQITSAGPPPSATHVANNTPNPSNSAPTTAQPASKADELVDDEMD